MTYDEASPEAKMVLNILARLEPGLTGFIEHCNSTPSELDAIAVEAHAAYRDELCGLEVSHMREAVQVYADGMLEAIREGSAPIPPLRPVT